MPDETKPTTDQKPAQLEPPKDIEDLLKELPKVNVPKMTPPPRPMLPPASQTAPPSLKTTEGTAKPLSPPPASNPQPPAPQSAKSYIRTMEDDLEAAKKGLKPEPKPFEIKPPPALSKPSPTPPTPPKLPSLPEVKLGPTEKAKTLELPKPIPPLPAPKGKFAISPKFLVILVLILAAASAAIWFFAVRESKPKVVLTPTPTPIPTPKSLSELITSESQITISSTENFLTALNNSLETISPSSGAFISLNIVDENGLRYSIPQIFERLQIIPPSGILENLDASDWELAAYGQYEMYDQNGLLTFPESPKTKLGLIAKTANPESLRSTLNTWETTMAGNLENLFDLDLRKKTSETFLDNVYSGTDIRYQNFPFADSTVDFAIVFLPRFNAYYFVLTSSRESIYSAIDLLSTQ